MPNRIFLLAHLASKGTALPGRMIHGLSFSLTLFLGAALSGCFRPPSGAETDEDEAAEWSRDSASSATEEALPHEEMVAIEARLVLQ